MVSESDFVAVHLSPLRVGDADFKIFARISDENEPPEWEQLWVKQLGNQQYEICCVPFFVGDLAVGGVVLTDDRLVIKSVAKRSGHISIRVWFGELPEEFSSDTGAKMFQLGFGIEWHSKKLLGIDCVNDQQAKLAAKILDEIKSVDPIQYEIGDQRLKP